MAHFVVDAESGTIVSTNLILVDEKDLSQDILDEIESGTSDRAIVSIAVRYGTPLAVRVQS